MIYKNVCPDNGEIFIDGARFDFELIDFSSKWAKINIIENGRVTSQHSVPTDIEIDKPVRTSGHQYKLIRPFKRTI